MRNMSSDADSSGVLLGDQGSRLLAFDFSLTGRGVVVVVLGLLGGGGEAPATVRWAVSWCVSARNRLRACWPMNQGHCGPGRGRARRRPRRRNPSECGMLDLSSDFD